MITFLKLRENKLYFVDKSLFIRDFLKCGNKVTLITKPKGFGKTLNMSMLSEFLDITKDSRAIFQGLAIMDTEFAEKINTMPVIHLSLQNCISSDPETMRRNFSEVLHDEYLKCKQVFAPENGCENDDFAYFYGLLNQLKNEHAIQKRVKLRKYHC
jgi:hypothetical protein